MNSYIKTKINNIFVLIGLACLLSNCNASKNGAQWDDVTIDSDLPHDSSFKRLDMEKEIFSMLEEQDSVTKRTSGVSYFHGKRIDFNKTEYVNHNNCRAYYFKSDTLLINIGYGTGFGGQGFVINYKDKEFYTEAYVSSDAVMVGEVEPVHKIIYQKLTLNKTNYSVGDSLFGKIEFKSIETSNQGRKTEHFGKGYFRAKVFKY